MSDTPVDVPAESPAQIAPHEEEGLAVSAAIGAMWTGSRLLIAACTFLFGAFAFAFFYLRSLNSHGLWHPGDQQPSVLIGTVAASVVVVSAVQHNAGIRRLRAGLNLDWRVAALTSLGMGVLGIGLQVWQLTRLNFYPGASGFASVFVGWVPVYVILMLGAMYWLETLIARGLRVRTAWEGEGGLGSSVTPEAIRLRASLDAFNYFWTYLALAGVGFWILFYLVG